MTPRQRVAHTAYALYAEQSSPKWFSLNPYGAYLEGSASFSDGFGPNSGLNLPDASTPSFAIGFTLPPDYTAGTAVRVNIVWHTEDTAFCGIVFRPNSIAVARPGRTHITGSGASSGLSVNGGNTLLNAPLVSNQSNSTRVSITSPDRNDTQLQAGDTIIFSLFRAANAASDTCTSSMRIQGMTVRYD